MYKLLSPVESDDNEWYFIDQVYDNKFEYLNWEGTKIYRQIYKKDGDIVSFDGDRVDLFQERLTSEEKEALDKMRSDYSKLQSDFEEYKNNFSTPNADVEILQKFQSDKLAEERKEAEDVLFEQFSELVGIEEFELLKTNASKFELDSLEKECYALLGKKTAKFSVSKTAKKDKVKIEFSKKDNENVGEFDELFSRYLKQE